MRVDKHYTVAYYDPSIKSGTADIVCPECDAHFDVDDGSITWEDVNDNEIGDVYCPKCNSQIMFRKEIQVTYERIRNDNV
jgi:predicted Zn finger-like uncharacterized protein